MQNSLVSIIMNCHNGEKYLSEAIKSIINQSYSNWEIIFWDNCSTDKSSLIIKSFNDLRIKYYKSSKFTNLGEARKLAFEKCAGEYVAFLDTDDIWFKEKLEKQLKYFENDVGIVTCNTIFFNEKMKEKLYKKKIQEGYIFDKLLENYNLSLETLIIKKKFAIKSNIIFDKDLSYISDFDFFLRLSKICKLRYVPEVLSGWRVHQESESWKKPNKFNEEKQIFINKIENFNPELISKYKNLWFKFKIQTLKKNAVHLIINNQTKEARKVISKNFVFNFQILIIYFLSFFFFSKNLFIFILNKRKKVKPV
jgi:glycosyltransferase involved in cell wall biosynthesis